jgi:type II secretory pathway component PulJ
MGFSSLLDIIGSTLIGGMLLLIMFRLNDAAAENTYNNSGELTSQQNIATIVQILETDFRKIGFCAKWEKIPFPAKSIVMADSNKIKFLTDVESDGTVDTMYYYVGSPNEILSTPNPKDRYLYRIVNGELPVKVNLGVTEFKLVYYDVFGNPINYPVAVPGEISSVEINIAVENVSAYDNQYSTVFWRQIRMTAQNLRNR